MEDLSGFMLNGLHLHQVWGVLPGSISATDGWREGGEADRQGISVGLKGLMIRGADECCATVRPSAAAACSLQPAGSASWTAGTSAREAAGRYWEETNRCRARAAPSLAPHWTCTQAKAQAATNLAEIFFMFISAEVVCVCT